MHRLTPRSHALGLIAALIIVGTILRIGLAAEFSGKPVSGSEAGQGVMAHRLLSGDGLSYDETLGDALLNAQEERAARVDLEDLEPPTEPERVRFASDDPGYALILAGVWSLTGSERWSHMVPLQLLLEVLTAIGVAVIAWKIAGQRTALWAVAALQFAGVSQMYWAAQPYHYAWSLYIVTAVTLGSMLTLDGRTRTARIAWCAVTLMLMAFAPFLRSTLLPMPLVVAIFWGLKAPRRRTAVALIALVIATTVAGAAVRTDLTSRLTGMDRAARGSMYHSIVAGFGNVQPNPYDIPQADADIAAHVLERTGSDATFPSAEYEAAAREYALEILTENPGYYVHMSARRFWRTLLDDGAMRWVLRQLGAPATLVRTVGLAHVLLSLALSALAVAGGVVLARGGKTAEAILLGGMWLFLPVVVSLIYYGWRYLDGGMGSKYVLAAIGGLWLWDALRGRISSAPEGRQDAAAL